MSDENLGDAEYFAREIVSADSYCNRGTVEVLKFIILKCHFIRAFRAVAEMWYEMAYGNGEMYGAGGCVRRAARRSAIRAARACGMAEGALDAKQIGWPTSGLLGWPGAVIQRACPASGI